jgi:hypothetical protein
MIRFACQSCGSRFQVENKAAGKKTKCPKCGTAIVVPAAGAPQPSPSPQSVPTVSPPPPLARPAAPPAFVTHPVAPPRNREPNRKLLITCIAVGGTAAVLVIGITVALTLWAGGDSSAPSAGPPRSASASSEKPISTSTDGAKSASDSATSDDKAQVSFGDGSPPKFESTSEEPVALQYKFQPAQRLQVTHHVVHKQNMRGTDRSRFDSQQTADWQFIFEVKNVANDGGVDAAVTNTRFKTSQTMRGSIRELNGSESIDSDSAADRANPKYRLLFSRLNQATPIQTFSRFGKTPEEAVGKPAKMPVNPRDRKESVPRWLIAPLPEAKVKVGARYSAVESAATDANGGPMGFVADMDYRVLAVSGDGQNVLLERVGRIQPAKAGSLLTSLGNPVDMKLTGWVLFDLAKGRVSQSYQKVDCTISMAPVHGGAINGTMTVQDFVDVREGS